MLIILPFDHGLTPRILLCHLMMACALLVPKSAGNNGPTTPSMELSQRKLFGNEMPTADRENPIELPVSRFAEPECSYEVHLDSPDGPLVDRKITIGEKLFHRWNCGYDDDDDNTQLLISSSSNRGHSAHKNSSAANSPMYCMMVHSCTVSSRNQKRHRRRRRQNAADIVLEIVDEFGCAIYTNITPEIDYVGDLSAVLQVQTFALDYDQPAVFFKCNVRLLLKINGRCRRPNCAVK